MDRTGTNVLDRRYEVTIAKPTASESGTNSARAYSKVAVAPIMNYENSSRDFRFQADELILPECYSYGLVGFLKLE